MRATVAALMMGSLAACGGGDTSVAPPSVARVDVSAATQVITAQQTVQLTAVAKGSDGVAIPSASITYSSSATNIATVSATGLVSGVAAGSAVISAKSGAATGTISITVTSGAGVLTRVVAGSSDAVLEIGSGTQATVEGRDALGGVVALGSRAIAWSSSNAGIATVSSGGAVNTGGVGAVTLTVSVQDGSNVLTSSTAITVTSVAGAPTTADVFMPGLLFNPGQAVVKVGGTVRYIFPATDHNVIWNPRLPGSPTDILVTTNATVSRTFTAVGVYPYDCTIHPGMSGRIIVSP
jgi:plastocyanin